MALLLIDGFETYGVPTNTPTDNLVARYSGSTTNCTIQTGRSSGYSMRGYTNTFTAGVLTSDRTLIAGIAIYAESTSTTMSLTFLDTAVVGINVAVSAATPTSTITIKRGNTTLSTTNIIPALLLNTWYYLELKVYCHPTAGTAEVRINGTTIVALTDIDTQAGTNLCHNSVRFGASTWCRYDDFYICDGSGTTANNLQGVCKISALMPATDASVQWTPSTGLTHYNLIDENPYVTTDYVSSGTQAHTDLYHYQELNTDNTIIGLQVSTICKLVSGIGVIVEMPISSNGVVDVGTDTITTNANYSEIRRISEIDPNTEMGWTANGLAAAQIGLKVM